MAQFALKFLSGKYQGGEFPLPDEGEMLIGRASDLDLVLVEDMVSRKHTKLSIAQDNVVIMDLGSTNGTFLNGKKIRRGEVKLGDRILIGTNIIKLIKHADMKSPSASAAQAQEALEEVAAAAPQSSTMSGELEDVPLPDLLQLFASNQKSGTLTITGSNRGTIFIQNGQLMSAVIGGSPNLPPMKAICRMVSWASGHFSLVPGQPEEGITQQVFSESTESILLEALRQADELRRLLHDLPAANADLQLVKPMAAPLRDLTPDELDIIQLTHNYHAMKTIIDRSNETDFNVCRSIYKFITDGYIEKV